MSGSQAWPGWIMAHQHFTHSEIKLFNKINLCSNIFTRQVVKSKESQAVTHTVTNSKICTVKGNKLNFNSNQAKPVSQARPTSMKN